MSEPTNELTILGIKYTRKADAQWYCNDIWVQPTFLNRVAELETALTLTTQRAEAALSRERALEAERKSAQEQLNELIDERDALRTVDDAMVERAAKYDYEATVVGDPDAWSRAHPLLQKQIRERMRAILNAALAVQPTTEATWLAVDKHGNEVARFHGEDAALAFMNDAQNGCAGVQPTTERL